jgi:transketolase
VAEALAQTVRPTPIRIVGIEDRFGESGKHEQLLQYFGLTARDIASAVREVLSRKQGTQDARESVARG